MCSAPVFGIVNTRPDAEILPVLGADFSKIGIVTTSADASNSKYPLNTAVRVSSTDPDMTSEAALGTGLLQDAVRGINDQIGPMGAGADIVIVRVAVGNDEAATLQNVVNGLDVMRTAPEVVNATPRIIVCPGYTHQVTSVGGSIDVQATPAGENDGDGVLTLAATPYVAGVQAGVYHVDITGGAKSGTAAAKAGGNTGGGTMSAVTVDATAPVGDWRVICGLTATGGGSFSVLKPDGSLDGIAIVGAAYNSTNGPTFTVADGTPDYAKGDEFVITVADSVPENGGTFNVIDPAGATVGAGAVGVAFSNQIAFTWADGQADFGVGDRVSVAVTVTNPTLLANPVVAALPDVCQSLLAVAPVDGPDSSRNAAENWREMIQSDRIIPLGVNVIVLEDGQYVTRPLSSRVAGIMVRVDNAHGGNPFHPCANQPVYGIVSASRPIAFSLIDGASEGQLMLAADLGVVVRGELGVDSALADGGFVFVATESAAEGDLWSQFHQVRAADYLTVKMMRITRQFLGKLVNADLAEAWLNSIKFMLKDHKAAGEILGYKVDFPSGLNSPEEIRLGHLTVTPRIEPGPCFRRATHQIMRYRPAVEQLVADILARMSAAGA